MQGMELLVQGLELLVQGLERFSSRFGTLPGGGVVPNLELGMVPNLELNAGLSRVPNLAPNRLVLIKRERGAKKAYLVQGKKTSGGLRKRFQTLN